MARCAIIIMVPACKATLAAEPHLANFAGKASLWNALAVRHPTFAAVGCPTARCAYHLDG